MDSHGPDDKPAKKVKLATASAVDEDEEESDWEDLDEVLDDFNQPKTADAASEPGRPSESAVIAEPDVDADADLNDAILQQLEKDMLANFMKPEPSVQPAASSAADSAQPDDIEKEINELSQQLQGNDLQTSFLKALIAEAMSGRDPEGDGGSGNDNSGDTASPGESFQDTIQRTMERMQESGERTTAALAQDDESTDLVSQLLKAAATREAPSNENVDLNDILMRAMEQIANKELLYEPMQELHEKFGPWIAENKGKGKVSDEEMARYEYQAQVVEQIVTKFNEEGYSDGNPECRAYIWEKVQELHGDGNPPEELLRNPFAEELNASGLDASGAQPPDCQPQ